MDGEHETKILVTASTPVDLRTHISLELHGTFGSNSMQCDYLTLAGCSKIAKVDGIIRRLGINAKANDRPGYVEDRCRTKSARVRESLEQTYLENLPTPQLISTFCIISRVTERGSALSVPNHAVNGTLLELSR